MKNKVKGKIIYIFIMLLLQSCASSITTPYQINRIFYGQSEKSIIKTMGSPAERKIINEDEKIFVYYIHSTIFDLFFNIERFPYLGFYPINRTGKEFWIILKNNRLKSSGYVKDLNKYNGF